MKLAREIQPNCTDWAKEGRNGGPVIVASREGKQEVISCPSIMQTTYDPFAARAERRMLAAISAPRSVKAQGQ